MITHEFEANEYEFTSYWSKKKNLKSGSTIFVNPRLSDDFFFNKVTNLCHPTNQAIKEALDEFEMQGLEPCFYVIDYDIDQFYPVISERLMHYDTMHVLKREPYNTDEDFTGIERIRKENATLWADIFCRSYQCPEWENEVTRIVMSSNDRVFYFADVQKESSCVALYPSNNILGLYCLGTVPNMRKKGHGRQMVEFATDFVIKCKLESLVLATFESDGLLAFYYKLGFVEMYKKKLLVMSKAS